MILLSVSPGAPPDKAPGVHNGRKVQELWHRELTWQAWSNEELALEALDQASALFLYK